MGFTRRNFVLLALCGTFAGAAAAHGPARLKVELDVEIAAPADKVWARIGNFHDMSWHPAVASTSGNGGSTADATRVLVLKGEGKPTIEEALKKHDAEGMSYAYKITKVDVAVLPVSNYASTLAVETSGAGKSRVVWKGAFYRGFPSNDPPPELNDEAAIKAVSGVYRSGLDALKAEIEGGAR